MKKQVIHVLNIDKFFTVNQPQSTKNFKNFMDKRQSEHGTNAGQFTFLISCNERRAKELNWHPTIVRKRSTLEATVSRFLLICFYFWFVLVFCVFAKITIFTYTT